MSAARCQTGRSMGGFGAYGKKRRPRVEPCPRPPVPNSMYCQECLDAAHARLPDRRIGDEAVLRWSGIAVHPKHS